MAITSLAELPDGLYRDVPAEVYHQRELGVVSNTALSLLAKSARTYRAWVRGDVERSTEALRFGRVLHTAILEPDVYASQYVVEPDFGDRRFKGPRAEYAAWKAEIEANGATIVTAKDNEMILGMAESVSLHEDAAPMVRYGEPEVTLLWTDPATGLRCKARLDYLRIDARAIIDVKTTADASDGSFGRSVYRYGYDRQRAFYMLGAKTLGLDIRHFGFLAMEKEPPYEVAVYTLDDRAIELGEQKVTEGMARMAECLRTDTWPGFQQRAQVLISPPWAA